MPEEKPKAVWQHDRKLSHKVLRELLTTVKDRLESVLEEKKLELLKMNNAKDSIKGG